MNITQERSKSAPLPGEPGDDGPLTLLTKKLTTEDALYYPQNIKQIGHYMVFAAYEEHAFQGSLNERQNKAKIGSAILPMPSNLQAAYQQDYKEEAVGAIGAAIGAAVEQNRGAAEAALQGKGNISSTLGSIAGDALKNIGVGGVANLAAGGGAAVVTNAVAGPVAAAAVQKSIQVAGAVLGKSRNPHMAVFYNSPQFRSFEFSFEMRPKSATESLSIGQIINFFKYYSAPEYALENHFFQYPNQFKIYFKHDDFLFKIGDTVLKNVSVDYHGEGTPLYYDATGSAFTSQKRKLLAPAVVKINLQFQEVKILTKKDILKKGR